MKKSFLVMVYLFAACCFCGCSGANNQLAPVENYDGMTIAEWGDFSYYGLGVERLRSSTTTSLLKEQNYATIETMYRSSEYNDLPYLIGQYSNNSIKKIGLEGDIPINMYLTSLCKLTKYTFVEFSNHPEVGQYSASGSTKFENSETDSIVRKFYIIDHATGKLHSIPTLMYVFITGSHGNESLEAGDYVYVRASEPGAETRDLYRIGIIEGEPVVTKISHGEFDFDLGRFFVDKYNNLFLFSIGLGEEHTYMVPLHGEIKVVQKNCFRWINGLVYTSDGRHYNASGDLVESSYIPDSENIFYLTTMNKILTKGNIDYYFHHQKVIEKITWIDDESCTIEQIILESYQYENAVLGERIYFASSCGCDLFWVDITTGEKAEMLSRYAIFDLVSTGKGILFSGTYKAEPIMGFIDADGFYSVSYSPYGLHLVYVWPNSH